MACVTREIGFARSGRNRPGSDHHEDRHKCDGQDGGKANCQGLCPGQRPEHTSFLRFEQEDRQKGYDDDEQGEEDGRAYLFGRIDKNLRRSGSNTGAASFS